MKEELDSKPFKHLAREGEREFAVILRNRSGQDAGEIDYVLAPSLIENLSNHDKRELLMTATSLLNSIRDNLGLKPIPNERPEISICPGPWRVMSFPSGSVCVSRPGTYPTLHISGPNPIDPKERDRFSTAAELASYLNGGVRPKWLSLYSRIGEVLTDNTVRNGTTSSITLSGPHIEEKEFNNADEVSRQMRVAFLNILAVGEVIKY